MIRDYSSVCFIEDTTMDDNYVIRFIIVKSRVEVEPVGSWQEIVPAGHAPSSDYGLPTVQSHSPDGGLLTVLWAESISIVIFVSTISKR